MLKKMGYEAGKGLGSKGQGLVKPVEAKLRKGKGAIGMYGKEAPDRPQKSKIKNC
jgi:tuftelin-interacting protein 11